MVNIKRAADIIGELSLMKYFPSEPAARTALVRIVCEMAPDEAHIRWLVNRALKLYAEWPGIMELRACYCSKFKPADGIEAYSQVYSEGIPTEKEQQGLIAAPEMRALPAGAPVSADAQMNAAVKELAAKKKMPSAKGVRWDETAKKLEQMGL